MAFLVSQNYRLPVETGHLLSSVFCEHRPDHFHSGIDIKTNKKNGYPLFAVLGGYILRVRVSPLGYGRVVYLKLEDGNSAVYAHMDAFIPEIENRVRKRQQETDNASVDVYFSPDEFPIKKGEIIGYSGNTGTIHSHLHFEIRDAKQRPLNPLKYLKIRDSVSPIFKKIAVVPLSENANVNSHSEIITLDCQPEGGNRYKIFQPIEATGKIGFSLLTWDGADDVNNFYHHYSVEFFVDDTLVFSSAYDKFSFSQTRKINWERNFSLMVQSKHKFQNLYFSNQKKLPFHSGGNGVLNLPVGEHDFTIVVEDFNGNSAILSGKIRQKPISETVKFSVNSQQFSEISKPAKISHVGEFVKLESDAEKFCILQDSVMTIFKVGSLFHPSLLRSGEIFIQDSDGVLCPAKISGTLVRTDKSEILVNSDSTFFIEFSANTFAHDTWVEIVHKTDAHRIEPRTIPLQRQAQIRFKQRENIPEKEQQIFYWKTKKSIWDMMINCSHKNGFVVAEIWSLESFRLGRDWDFPEISPLNFADGGTYFADSLRNFNFSIPDVTSDWVMFDSIAMELDGEKVYPFYNPHHDELEYRLIEPLEIGAHVLKLTVSDFADHTTTRVFNFLIE